MPWSLKIRINTVDREWSTLFNEMTRVKTIARKAVDSLTDEIDTHQLVIEEVLVDELKQSERCG